MRRCCCGRCKRAPASCGRPLIQRTVLRFTRVQCLESALYASLQVAHEEHVTTRQKTRHKTHRRRVRRGPSPINIPRWYSLPHRLQLHSIPPGVFAAWSGRFCWTETRGGTRQSAPLMPTKPRHRSRTRGGQTATRPWIRCGKCRNVGCSELRFEDRRMRC